jgi:hypothetical protein
MSIKLYPFVVLIIFLTIGVIAAPFYIRLEYTHVLSQGTDSFETHYPIYTDKTYSQEVTISRPIHGVAAIVVNLHGAQHPTDMMINVTNKNKEDIAFGIIKAIDTKDDTFASAELSAGIPVTASPITIHFSAPEATKENPIGLRYDKQTNELALALIGRVSILERIKIWANNHNRQAQTLGITLGIGLAMSILIYSLLEITRFKRQAFILALILLAVMTVMIRIPLAVRVESAFGGDTFNYLLKSQAWLMGEDPFSIDPRKGPLLALLLLPGLVGVIDPLLWGRLVSIFAAAVAVILVPLFLRKLKLPYSLAITAGLLLTVNRDFQFESLHGLANALYAALFLASGLLFLLSIRRQGAYSLGILTGLAALTRYEGLLIAAVLLPFAWVKQRLHWSKVLHSLFALGIIICIPFLVWPLTGNIGVRTFSDVSADGGLYLVRDFGDFAENLKRARIAYGRSWLFIPSVSDHQYYLVAGLIAGYGALWLRRAKAGRFLILIPFAITIAIYYSAFRGSPEHLKHVTLLLSFLSGAGITALLLQWKKTGPIILLVVLEFIAITFILPKTRYYLWLIPFITIAICSGFYILSNPNKKLGLFGVILAICTLAALVYADSLQTLPGTISEYNSKSHDQTITLRAAKHLTSTTGSIAIGQFDLPLQIYIGPQRLIVVPPRIAGQIKADARKQLDWLKKYNATIIVESSARPFFTPVLEVYPEQFALAGIFKTRFASSEARVYRFSPDQ